jgi:hypothetical protein
MSDRHRLPNQPSPAVKRGSKNRAAVKLLVKWGCPRPNYVGAPGAPLHIWSGADTLCRMLSTGGLNIFKLSPHSSRDGRKVCELCAAKLTETFIELPEEGD